MRGQDNIKSNLPSNGEIIEMVNLERLKGKRSSKMYNNSILKLSNLHLATRLPWGLWKQNVSLNWEIKTILDIPVI